EMLELFKDRGAWPVMDGSVTVSTGKAVGGSTLMYTGVTFRLPDDVCKEWNVEGITPQDLKPRFDRLVNEVHAIEPDEETFENDNNRLFRVGCEKLGIPVEKLLINIKDCEQMGFCNLACARGHKQGTMEVQVPRALKAGIELIPNCTAERIKTGKVFATVLPAPDGTRPGALAAGSYELKAKKIILAGGTAGTPAILLRSGFQAQLPAIGKYVTLHPAMVVCGIYPTKIKNYKGFPKIYFTQAFSKTHHYYLETAFYYPFIQTKHTGLWGAELKYVMKHYNNLMDILILAHDDALPENKIMLDKNGEPQLSYTLTKQVIASLCHAQAQCAKIFVAAGCEEAVIPSAKKPLFKKSEVVGATHLEEFISPKYFLPNKTPVASAHPQGGCRMGTNTETSVTNSWGQVHGHDWLYVADASLFPKSSHVNPYLTIMALADRVAEKVAATV
ncbi:MAG TPA: GMC family oxidoreductase N-terminal domain-containing protein, partial [Chitinophagales bacterium]|nr:GMC family oxidoreductase N-terminal domain-containing protein [Chitinophagales bacterium]